MIANIKRQHFVADNQASCEIMIASLSAGAAEKLQQFPLGEIDLGGTIPHGEGSFTLPNRLRVFEVGIGHRQTFDFGDFEDAEDRAKSWGLEIHDRLATAFAALTSKERTAGEETLTVTF